MIKIHFVLAAALMFAVIPVAAQGNGHGKGKGHNKGESEIAFSSRDREVIGRYFEGRQSNLPPGLAKRNGNLPPGLQKQLERNGTLPPGLQKRVQYFPPELESQLPPLPETYHRVLVGQIAVILDQRTQRIIDVIHNVTAPFAR